jgi:membrane protease YdiL (CAAX protease family)
VKTPDSKNLTIFLKVSLFVFFAIAGEVIAGQLLWLMMEPRIFAVSALSVFAAAAAANALAMRIWERGNLLDVGFAWNSSSVRNLLVGLAAGIVPALVVVFAPVLEGAAEFTRTAQPIEWGSVAFVLVMLVFGAIGEEMLFHGYAFQVLMGVLGPFATILPVSALFAFAHVGNLNITSLGLLNTGLWGMVFGFAFWRSGDLWLPIGMHLGWNWVLPLAGVNLSGFTMNVTGVVLHWRAGYERWSGGAYGPEGGLLCTVVLGLLFLWLILKAPIRRQTPYLLQERWDEIGGPESPSKE